MENFCEEHNAEFKEIYNKLNNPVYMAIVPIILNTINTQIMRNKILNMIIENHQTVIQKLNTIDIIISYYKENNLINKSEIGKFFSFYEEHRNNININSHKHLLELFYKLISYDKCITVLKECFYIFSEYRACIYFMTPSIDFYNTQPDIIDNVILKFRDNTNTLNQILSKIYLGDNNPWQSKYYSSAYSMFETLFIIKKYFKSPLNKLNIKFNVFKECPKNKIINNICKKYHDKKFTNSDFDNKLNSKNINNISQFIINLKRLGYDMWFVIPLVFDAIYESYELLGVQEGLLIDGIKIYQQKMNNKLGIMCFILADEGYISNVNIFNNFND
jgi:hypothetical protein